MKKKRLDYLDLAKGIGLMLVLAGHTAALPRPFSAFIYSFHMPLFFVLSGITFHYDISCKAFLLKKVRTLLLPYISFSALYVAGCWLKGLVLQQNDNVLLLAKKIFLQEDDYIFATWFLVVLFVTELVFFLLAKAANGKRSVIIAVTVAVLAAGIVYFKTLNAVLPFELQIVLTALPFFCGGYFIKQFNLPERLDKLWIILALGAVSIGLFLVKIKFFTYFTSLHNNRYGNFAVFYTLAITAILFVLLVCHRIKTIRFLNYLGKNTLVIFALQQLFICMPFDVWRSMQSKPMDIGAMNPLMKMAVSGLELAVSIIVLLAINYLFTYTPLCVLIGKAYIKKKQ